MATDLVRRRFLFCFGDIQPKLHKPFIVAGYYGTPETNYDSSAVEGENEKPKKNIRFTMYSLCLQLLKDER